MQEQQNLTELANGEWVNQYPHTKAHFPEPVISDHCGVEVQLTQQNNTRLKPFRFFNSWASHGEYKQLVHRVWEERRCSK